MKRAVVPALCVALLGCGAVANGADKAKARAISQYCHICEAAARIGIQLVGMLAKHPYEGALAAYAEKIGEANVYIFKRLKPPAEARDIKEHFGKAVVAFEKAVALHRKAEYQASDEAGAKCKKEFWAAVFAVQKLRKDGVIP